MRKFLLVLAAFGFLAVLGSPLVAQGDDGPPPPGGGGGNPPPPPNPPPPNPPPPNPPPPNPPPPGGYPGWGGGGGGGGGWGGPSYPPPNPPPPAPVTPPPPPPPTVPPAGPSTPPGGSPAVPGATPAWGGNNPTAPSTPAPSQPPVGGIGGPAVGGPTSGPSTGNPGMNPGQPTNPGASGNGVLSSRDTARKDAIDRPAGGVKMRLPSSSYSGNGSSNGTGNPPGTNGIPPGELPPGAPPAEDPPTFYGEPVQGKFVFVLDASGSMAGSRIASLRAEASTAINDLTENDELDVMAYGTQFGDSTAELWSGLMPATDGNKSQAITFVTGPACNPGGGTPTYRALQKACQMYPKDLDKMFLLTDGYPNATGSAGQILADFPGWWSDFDDEASLVCICIGGVGQAQQFMQSLAALSGPNGIYIARP